MQTSPPRSRLRRKGFLAGSWLFFSLALPLWSAEELPKPTPSLPPAAPVPPPLVVDLAACRKLALEKQPALAAYRASLAGAHLKVEALDNLGHLAALFRKDLGIRQRQAALGVAAAEARLHQAESETLYAVTRLYWTAAYASSQLANVDKVLVKEPESKGVKKKRDFTKLKTLYELQEALKDIRKNQQSADKWTELGMESFITLVQARREEARQGYQRALAGLREAIGLAPCVPLVLADDALPQALALVCRGQVVALALDRRPEVMQAVLGAEIIGLEIEAQGLSKQYKVETFAIGSDLHAQSVPITSFGDDYHPGAVVPEVPPVLVGLPCSRVEQAKAIHARALAVVDKTKGLVALEAEDTYLRWEEAHNKQGPLDGALTKGEDSTRALMELLGNPPLVKEEVVSKASISDALASVLRTATFREQAERNQLQEILQLAALERVTAGGICPVYQQKPITKDKDAEPDPKKDPKKDNEKGNAKQPDAGGVKGNQKAL